MTTVKRKSYARRRAAEPSTYAGLGSILALALQFVPPQYQAIAAAAGALAGAVAVFKGDPQSSQGEPVNNPGNNP